MRRARGVTGAVRPWQGSGVDDPSNPRRIVEVLAPYVSEARRARIEAILDARTRDVVVVLEDVVNDHNGAAVMRTADAMGLQELHLVPNEAGFRVSRKVARGAHKWVDARHHRSAPEAYRHLRASGYRVWASSVHGATVPVAEVPREGKVALVFGNEREGVSRAALEQADGRFHVPMHGFVESLNISVAAALALSAVVGGRRAAGRITPLAPDDRAELAARWYQRSVRAAEELLARAGLSPVPDPSEDVVIETEGRYGARVLPGPAEVRGG